MEISKWYESVPLPQLLSIPSTPLPICVLAKGNYSMFLLGEQWNTICRKNSQNLVKSKRPAILAIKFIKGFMQDEEKEGKRFFALYHSSILFED